MIGAPQDCKPRIDFCIVLSDQDHPLWFTVSQSRLVHLVRVQSPSPTAGWNRTGETTMLQTLCFPPQIFNFKKRDRYTIAIKEHYVEIRKDQAEGCQDEGAGPCMVGHVKATGLADREENPSQSFFSRALHASTARPPGCHCRPML